MMFSWPPTGRMSENYSQRAKAINFVPHFRDRRQGRLRDHARQERRDGVGLRQGAERPISANPEAAYLFMQWVDLAAGLAGAGDAALHAARSVPACRTTPRRSTARCGRHAKDYLITLAMRRTTACVDMIMPGWQDYALSLDRMCTAVWAGEDPKAALEKAAAEWDAITHKIGVDAQTRGLRGVPEAAGLATPTTRSRRWAWRCITELTIRARRGCAPRCASDDQRRPRFAPRAQRAPARISRCGPSGSFDWLLVAPADRC